MPVTTTNLIQGPASLWVAAFGAAEPATPNTAPAVAWVDCGGTQDGVALTVEQEFSLLTVDQILDNAGATRSKRSAKIKTNLAEATLANWAVALNELPASVAAGSFEPVNGNVTAAFVTPYNAVLLRGLGPNGVPRDVILRRALQTGSSESSYKRDSQTLIPVEFECFYVSTTVKPFKLTDGT
jgi:hypothetical protein